MAPESCQEAAEAEEDALPSLADREPVSGHLEPPAGSAADLGAPECLQDTKPSSTTAASPISLQPCRLAPECLDPHTLRLLWRQRELEIQALRAAIQNQQDARRGHILREVAGLPLERSSCNQEKLLQIQVQKLTAELQEQKKQAQLVKEHLEEQLRQTRATLQQLEAELQALHKSCLLQLARTSWVGRTLRSSTGSVEVVTAETLMNLSDLSDSDEAPPAGEGFRLGNVDWNSIAHRYPNLFTDIKSNLDHNLMSSCLKIVDVSRRKRFVRILNESLEETADLGGFALQQLSRHFPVCMYRFPPSTLLAPRHHLTVWGQGTDHTTKGPPSSPGQEPVHFHSSRGCVTLLLNPKGEVLSEHHAPHCAIPSSRIFDDNTDLSIDRFPLSEARPGVNTREQRHPSRPSPHGRAREARAGRLKPGTRTLLPRLSPSKLSQPPEVPARPASSETHTREPQLAVPQVGRLGITDGQAREHRVQVRRKSVDQGCPLVALSVQSTAESRFGFRSLSCLPITADACGGSTGCGRERWSRQCQLHRLLNQRRRRSKPHSCAPEPTVVRLLPGYPAPQPHKSSRDRRPGSTLPA